MSSMASCVANAVIGVSAFFLCLATMWQFVWYLSSHDHLHFRLGTRATSGDGGVFWPLLVDAGLLCSFIFQHSIMTKNRLGRFLPFHKEIDVLQRTAYTIATCFVLQLMMRYWQPVHRLVLWEINTSNHATWWWIFTSTHWLLWFVIYGGVLVMDVGELLGLKQVYYSTVGLPDPLLSKSRELRRLYRHMRHPSLTALAVILWFHPIMRLDRTLLASVLIAYMLFGFRLDERDHAYHRHQLLRKEWELKSS